MLLKDENVISQIWPEAKDYADSDLFSNLHIKFDRKTSDVSIATAGTTFTGMPIHSTSYQLTGELTATPLSMLPPQEQVIPLTQQAAASTQQPFFNQPAQFAQPVYQQPQPAQFQSTYQPT